MKLSNEQLKSIFFGAYSFAETTDGYLQAFQHTKEQMEYFKKVSDFWYVRADASNAKTLEFKTDATEFSFEYKFLWIGSIDSIELAVDGLIRKVYTEKDLKPEGKISFNLPEGEKSVVVYLTADSTVVIRNFEINGDFVPVEKGEKVLWLGDSITQGYGPYRSSHTYVSTANRYLNYDIINQGIGGYKYDENSLVKMEGYIPDKIIAAYGTNQYKENYEADIAKYYERLSELYGDIPVLCITPVFRCDEPECMHGLTRLSETIKRICSAYPNVKVADGFRLVPHTEDYFHDKLHPNALGGEIYGRNLVMEIHRLGF